MEKLKIQEVVVVEGKYDLNSLKQVIDGVVLTTDGFGVFKNQEKLELIRKMAESRGVIVLTDSDGAGFLIRNHLKGALPKDKVKHAYIPDVYGKERRKRTASKEGKLGVEGMRPEVIRQALISAGATIDGDCAVRHGEITKADLFSVGLSGGQNSAEHRKVLLTHLGLPERLTANALLDVLNALMDRASFMTLCEKLYS